MIFKSTSSSFLLRLVGLLKLLSFIASLTALCYLLLNPSKYEIASSFLPASPTLGAAVLLLPAIVPLLDILKLLPTSFKWSFLRFLPSFYFSSLLIRMGLADYRMEDYVVNRGSFFSIRRVWSEEEKLGWINEQLLSTPYTLQTANFGELAKNSNSLSELKLNYSSFLLQLQEQQRKAAECRGFRDTVYQFCVDHPFLLVGGTVAISAMVICYLVYSRPTPSQLWEEQRSLALRLLLDTKNLLQEVQSMQKIFSRTSKDLGDHLVTRGSVARLNSRVHALEVNMPEMYRMLKVASERSVSLLSLKELAESGLYVSTLTKLVKLLSENEESLERLNNLLQSPLNQYFRKK